MKRNRFIALDGATKSVNRELEAKARDLAGLKGYVTNLAACPDGTPVTADFVIGSYHELWNIEKSFRMSKSDLRARPIYHRKRDSIEAHLTIVFAALAVSRFIEGRTDWSIRKFVRGGVFASPAPERRLPDHREVDSAGGAAAKLQSLVNGMLRPRQARVEVVWNPEFLREGSAVGGHAQAGSDRRRRGPFRGS